MPEDLRQNIYSNPDPGESVSPLPQPEEAMDYEASKQHSREVGAKILSRANFETRHQSIVDNSFNKARQKGEKLSGKNNERRNYSYLDRIEKLVDKYGSRLEKRLWHKSAEQLIISPEDITDDYWRTQEQILRDNGQGYSLDDYEKRALIQDIQKSQRESLKSWSNYLGSEDSPYPMWFKVYAWDGMSKMGVFDKRKQQFAKRNKHTVAPYPKLNPAVLAKVYGTISDFYDQSGQDRYEENSEHDAELEALAKSGNFNKLYSKILLTEKAIPRTPEKTEDIRGEWIEYLPGDEEKLATAAEGTPWCIADTSAGYGYLERKTHGYGEGHDGSENKAKFILFHLQDPETNILSSSACASIRLGFDGEVAEVSGLNEGQALEDSLIPIVEDKVKTLPGGERFLKAFDHRKRLIALDHKMQNGEELAKNELEFIYEINSPIYQLNEWIEIDPRVAELRTRYPIKYALDCGVDPDKLSDSLKRTLEIEDEPEEFKLEDFKALLDYGASADKLMSLVSGEQVYDELGFFLEANIPPALLRETLDPDESVFSEYYDTHRYIIPDPDDLDLSFLVHVLGEKHKVLDNLKSLYDYGAPIGQMLSGISQGDKKSHLNEIVDIIGVDNYVNNSDRGAIQGAVNELLELGADVDRLIDIVHPSFVLDNIDNFISHGASINYAELAHRAARIPADFRQYADKFIEHGFGIEQIAQALAPSEVVRNIDTLTSLGAEIDMDQLVSGINQYDGPAVFGNFNKLIRHGADVSQLLSRFKRDQIQDRFGMLLNAGAKFEQLSPFLRPSFMIRHLDDMLGRGVEIDQIASALPPTSIIRHLDELTSRGARINLEEVASNLSQEQISEYADVLRRYGVRL